MINGALILTNRHTASSVQCKLTPGLEQNSTICIYIYIKRFNATRTSKEGLRFPESVVKTSHGSGELLISSLNSTFMSQAESKINQSLFGLEMEKLRHAQDD